MSIVWTTLHVVHTNHVASIPKTLSKAVQCSSNNKRKMLSPLKFETEKYQFRLLGIYKFDGTCPWSLLGVCPMLAIFEIKPTNVCKKEFNSNSNNFIIPQEIHMWCMTLKTESTGTLQDTNTHVIKTVCAYRCACVCVYRCACVYVCVCVCDVYVCGVCVCGACVCVWCMCVWVCGVCVVRVWVWGWGECADWVDFFSLGMCIERVICCCCCCWSPKRKGRMLMGFFLTLKSLLSDDFDARARAHFYVIHRP